MTDRLRVAFQGETGAYSELAALEYFKDGIITVPHHSFDAVFDAVVEGTCTFGVIPIENSLAGSIHRNYDLILRHEVFIVGEYHLRVSHCLVSLPGAKVEDIRRVYSHPQALAQCEASLFKMGVECIPGADTAGSARQLIEMGDLQAAALASRHAAQVYGLQILSESMEDNPFNYTRFLVLTCQPLQPVIPDEDEYKTSIVFNLKNHPGALFRALGVFALRDIDLTKIESRPIPGQPWEYMFYIDFAGQAAETKCQRALEHLQELAPFLRVLGSYPRHRIDYT